MIPNSQFEEIMKKTQIKIHRSMKKNVEGGRRKEITDKCSKLSHLFEERKSQGRKEKMSLLFIFIKNAQFIAAHDENVKKKKKWWKIYHQMNDDR